MVIESSIQLPVLLVMHKKCSSFCSFTQNSRRIWVLRLLLLAYNILKDEYKDLRLINLTSQYRT